jgi:predicted neuraminidase
VTLENGHWALAYNDTESGRRSLAVSISDDYGDTWKWTRHLELDDREEQATTAHYPAIIQGADGQIHVIYSYHHGDRQGAPHKTIKHAAFSEAWVMESGP